LPEQLAAAVVAPDLYAALVVMVMLTTFVAPAWLRAVYRPATDVSVSSRVDGARLLNHNHS
jgi:hypothetical protein